MKQPFFSIITATYNSLVPLQRTAESLDAQDFRDFEWIVVDGGSSDGTVDAIRAMEHRVSWWVSEPDGGIADAWNKGIQRARGGHVVILNAGDTFDTQFLSKIARRCDGQRIVCSQARICTESGESRGIFKAEPARLRVAMHLPHNWCAVPRSRYLELGVYRPLPLAMDFDWFHRYYKRYGADGFIVLDEVLGTYYLGGTSDQR